MLATFLPVAAIANAVPTRLTTDMLEHTERVFAAARPAPALTLADFRAAPAGKQVVEIRNERPNYSWNVPGVRDSTLQVAYRVLVATSAEKLASDTGDVWDSGRVESAKSVAVPHGGKPLAPATLYFWKVKTWDNHGRESAFSAPKSFLTAAVLDGITARYPLQISDEKPVLVREQKTVAKTTANPAAAGAGAPVVFVDFGKAAFGKLRLKLTSEKGGETVTVRLGECVTKDGAIDRRPGGSRRFVSQNFKLKAGTHDYTTEWKIRRHAATMPAHIGEVVPFRYAEIENYAATGAAGSAAGGKKLPLSAAEITREHVHYPFDDSAASFASDNTVLNAVWELSKYTMKATSYTGVYVDGDRERCPYEADAYINQLGHYCCDREYAIGRYTHEFLITHPTWPTEWILHSVLMAWDDFLYTGDERSLRKFYGDLQAKTLFALRDGNNLVSTRTGKLTKDVLKSIHSKGELRDIVDWPHGERDGFVFTKYNSVVNAFHYEALICLGKIARVLKKPEEGIKFEHLAIATRGALLKGFFDTERGVFADGFLSETKHASLHANMLARAFGLVPHEHRKSVSEFIRSRGMACSVYGAQYLFEALYNSGEKEDAEHALKLLTSTGIRSWHNMLRAGSTIAMEAWDNKFKPNQDWNHAWGAAPANIIMRKLVGVEPLSPGFEKILIRPQTGSLRSVDATVPTPRGSVKVSVRNDGVTYRLTVEIPPNTEAYVQLPVGKHHAGTTATGRQIGSGRHEFAEKME
ncbi:MAG: family 78 glycoside hydrolase catalytic domain [Puniceicoccales bacterium]|nr:family 78 glycoside hydrolase catalytic domain [Puniceicoccales bacterium]